MRRRRRKQQKKKIEAAVRVDKARERNKKCILESLLTCSSARCTIPSWLGSL